MMKADKWKEMDNRGMTLVELLIAMAVSAVILAAVTMFAGNAQKSYQNAQESVNLQMESQVLMEQLGGWIMEGNRIEAAGSILTVYDIPRKITTPLPDGVSYEDKTTKRVIWESDGKLYMKVIDNIADPDSDTSTVGAADETKQNCIGLYVTGFMPQKDAADPAKVKIILKLEQGNQEYEVENEIVARNEIV